MTTYVLINSACDGRHVHVYKSEARAFKALANYGVHPAHNLRLNRDYYSDWGNRLCVEERPDGWTAQREQSYAAAYDAREMGTATKRQLATLERLG